MTDTSPISFSSYKFPKTIPDTTLLLFGPVSLLCVIFLFTLLSEGSVKSSDCEHHQFNRDGSLPITSGGASELPRNFTPHHI